MDCKNKTEADVPPREDIVEQLGKLLAVRDKKAIVGILKRVKDDNKAFDDLINKAGIVLLIKIMKFQNAKVMDYTLSILANAFLRRSVREKTNDPKLIKNTLWILQNLPPGPTLHCRACRLLGNLCLSEHYAQFVCIQGGIPVLSTVIKSDPSTQTLSTVIRTIKNIWVSYKPSHVRILDVKLVKDISHILGNTCDKYFADQTQTKYKHLLETCMKAVNVFVQDGDFKTRSQFALSLSRPRIVYLCENKFSLAFNILTSLAKLPENRPELGTCNAIKMLINCCKSTNPEFLLNPMKDDIITALCLFAREAVNRAKIRDNGGIQVLLKLLSNDINEAHHNELLLSLTQFRGDDESLKIMLDNGIVTTLANIMGKMLDREGPTWREEGLVLKTDRERILSRLRSVITEDSKMNGVVRSRFSLDYIPGSWSPSSSSAPSDTSSPSDSPPSYSSYDDENNYSPVCSETEDNDDTRSTRDEIDSLNSCPSSSSREKKCASYVFGELCEISVVHSWILQILTRFTYWHEPIEELVESNNIRSFTNYIDGTRDKAASIIIMRIIDNYIYFVPLLLGGFVFTIENSFFRDDYINEFSKSADRAVAFGEMSAILRRGREDHKVITVLSIPFLLQSRTKFRRLLLEYNGLDIILELLKDSSHTHHERAIQAICELAIVLEVKPSKESFIDQSMEVTILSSSEEDDEEEEEEEEDEDEEELRTRWGKEESPLVTFELDDGSIIKTDRTLLCKKSEVFRAMLDGEFSEAGRAVVRLRDVPADGLKILFSAASGIYPLIEPEGSEKDSIEAVLDAVLLADKFLMTEESEGLTDCCISDLSHETLHRAWTWSRKNQCSDFKICCVESFLTKRTTKRARVRAFEEFSNDQNFGEFLDDIRAYIVNDLENNS